MCAALQLHKRHKLPLDFSWYMVVIMCVMISVVIKCICYPSIGADLSSEQCADQSRQLQRSCWPGQEQY